MLHDGVSTEIEEPSSPSGLSRDLPSSDPQLGKRIQTCWILSFSLLPLTVILWFAESTGVAQVEDPAASIGVKIAQFKLQPENPVLWSLLSLLLRWKLLQQ